MTERKTYLQGVYQGVKFAIKIIALQRSQKETTKLLIDHLKHLDDLSKISNNIDVWRMQAKVLRENKR